MPARRPRPLRHLVGLGAAAVLAVSCTTDRPEANDPEPPDTSATTMATPPPGQTTAPTTTEPATGDIIVTEPVVMMDRPLSLVARPGDDALYVVERDGRVVPLRGEVLGDPVLDDRKELSDFTEDGLLGLAFSEDGAKAYINRTETDIADATGITEIIEYAVAADGTFEEASARVVYTLDQPYHQHNGGEILLGPDGLLWIPTGDGGGEEDPDRVAMDLASPLGKILRLDPTPSAGQSFTVPSDNPFVGVPGALPEIWSTGLRNPWRASFDRLTGDLWLGDVGENSREELNVAWADEGLGRGSTYGWSAYEGTMRLNEDQQVNDADEYLPPIHEYGRDIGGCSISAGERYRGAALPDLWGWFVYADLCNGDVVALEITDQRTVGRQMVLGNVVEPVAVRADADGELWVLSYRGGVHRIIAAD